MRPAALLLALLLAGCSGTATPPSERPNDWDEGEELLAHSTARYHSGGFDARVFPEGDADRPASCVAYRANQSFSGDSCTVLDDESEHWFPIGDPPWGLWGQWEGRGEDTADEPDPNLPRLLVAYDSDGEAIAYWDGKMHPDASYATE